MNPKRLSYLLFVVILCIYSFTYYQNVILLKPYGMHSWAQADRLSLAINFYDRGMDFLKPATYNLTSNDGVVGVEFPLMSYLAATVAKVLGRAHISTIFRCIDMLLACLGLFFLFRAGYERTKNFIFSIATPLLIYSSPVFIFYACNYMPDTSSASVVFIAFYFILQYQEKERMKDMVMVIALLTLASLIKTSGTLYLIAFISYVSLQRIFTKERDFRHNLTFITAIMLAATVLIVNYLQIQHLNEKYQSTIFLAQTMPFKSWGAISDFIEGRFIGIWMYEYLIWPEYFVVLSIVIPGVALLLQDREGKKRLLLATICFAGTLSVSYLMGGAFFDHDYFFIVIFLPTIAYWLLASILALHKNIQSPERSKLFQRALLSTVAVLFYLAQLHNRERLQQQYKGFPPALSWAAGGDILLKRLNVPDTEHILILNDAPPNLALLYCDRKGYNLSPGSWSNMGEVRAHMDGMRVNLGVIEKQFCLSQQQNDTTFNKFFAIVATEGNIAVFKVRE